MIEAMVHCASDSRGNQLTPGLAIIPTFPVSTCSPLRIGCAESLTHWSHMSSGFRPIRHTIFKLLGLRANGLLLCSIWIITNHPKTTQLQIHALISGFDT